MDFRPGLWMVFCGEAAAAATEAQNEGLIGGAFCVNLRVGEWG